MKCRRLPQAHERNTPGSAHLTVEQRVQKPRTGLLVHGMSFGLSKRIAAQGLALIAALNPALLPPIAQVSATVANIYANNLDMPTPCFS